MDLHPSLAVEDLTDEDFFNNLVEDDISAFELSSFSREVESDEARELGNLIVADTSTGLDDPDDKGSVIHDDKQKDSSDLSNLSGSDNITASTSSKPDDNTAVSNEDAMVSGDAPYAAENRSSVSEKSGCKEVQWSSFNTDVSQSDANGGSYVDFFCELAGKDLSTVPEEDCASSEFNRLAGYQSPKAVTLEDSYHHDEYQQGNTYAGSVDDDVNTSQSWDNLYPGWKYDVNIGQWYKIEESYDGLTKTSGNLEGPELKSLSDASYSQENVQYIDSKGSESQTFESYANYNQRYAASEFPDHMIVDPQYPGWYYDAISQEWRALGSDHPPLQTISQSHVIPDQNGVLSSETYSIPSYSQNHASASYSQSTGATAYSENIDSQSYDAGMFSQYGQAGYVGSQDLGEKGQNVLWNGSYSTISSNSQGSETVGKFLAVDDFNAKRLTGVPQNTCLSLRNHVAQQKPIISAKPSSHLKYGNSYELSNGNIGVQSFAPNENFIEKYHTPVKHNELGPTKNVFVGDQQPPSFSMQPASNPNHLYFSNPGRSSAGRPPHALVTFGFGGKLIIMKDEWSPMNSPYKSTDNGGQSVSILNLIEVMNKVDSNGVVPGGTCNYFNALCQQSFPGPLIGGSVGSREVNKWVDERIANCESTYSDFQKGEPLRLLLSLLKIACQNYGKLRSPFGTSTVSRESDGPESAVAKLFASAKRSNNQFNAYGSVVQCLKGLPSEGQLRATAAEVQGLLVSGRTKEALQSAQEGQLWGPALVLAAQLGNQFYVDTVKQMALSHLVAGSPLRTLCLLVAGQPADVFAADMHVDNSSCQEVNTPQQSGQLGVGMLNDWEENLAVITANRTKGDELVIIHLGDCIWKERAEVAAAHICYLVAEANFEPYSDTARLCLIGADHWKFPRTFVSPEAIQRTELYEYSKVLGNSQFILLPFQPYKLIYAHMLAEVGKISDAVKYCQAVLKSLRTVREPEVEIWKHLLLSLEDRAKTHLQGGFTTGPAKLVGKLLNFFDNTAHRVVGGLPPPIPSTSHNTPHNREQHHPPRVYSSQSTMAMSSLLPSASMEPISEMAADGGKRTMHSRSVSEPDFGRTPRQINSSKDEASSTSHANDSGSSRFHFGFGRQILQKTVAFVLNRPDRQAKLGETNKFYYDEKLNRWVEHGAESSSEEPALPPPPTMAVFQPGSSDDTVKSVSSSGSPESEKRVVSEYASGTPPIPASSNHFSGRSRAGVRSRYVDTFNQGSGGPATNLFPSSPLPSARAAGRPAPKFFVPTPVRGDDGESESTTIHEPRSNESALPSTTSVQRFPSMSNISDQNGNLSLPPHSRRTASWGGSFNSAFSPPEIDVRGAVSSSVRMGMSSGNFGDDLQEVEL